MRTEGVTTATQLDSQSLALAYMTAKEFVIESGFADEIDWQYSRVFSAVTESSFLREGAWVILSAGMRETVIRSKFEGITRAFLGWRSAGEITRKHRLCESHALAVFANVRKIKAIVRLAQIIAKNGFRQIKQTVEERGIEAIRSFPFMGPATSYHFAKNLGLDVVKPDRHLVRVAAATGYQSPDEMCRNIAEVTSDKLSVIDLVIWRYATIQNGYLDHFSGCNA